MIYQMMWHNEAIVIEVMLTSVETWECQSLNGMIKWIGVTSAIHYQLLASSQQITQVRMPTAQFQFARAALILIHHYLGLDIALSGLVKGLDATL